MMILRKAQIVGRISEVWRIVVNLLFIINSVLLISTVLTYIMLSYYGTNGEGRLIDKANATFSDTWYLKQEIPQHLPLQQLVWFSSNGSLKDSLPARLDQDIQELLDDWATTEDPNLHRRIESALGSLLEPLRDRYPYIGRTPTFRLLSYPQADESVVVIALWRPLTTRLLWLSYAVMIYLYLSYWILAVLWVYTDTRKRQIYPWKWTFLTALANIVGVCSYLIARQKTDRAGMG